MKIKETVNKYRTYFKEISYLLGDDKRKIPFMVSIFLLSSFVDLLGIGLLAPYVSFVLSPTSIDNIEFFSYIKTTFPMKPEERVVWLGIFLIGVFIFKGIVSYWVNKAILSFAFDKVDKLRAQLMESYQDLPYIEYLKRNSSEYIHSITTLTSNFTQGTVQSLLRLMSELMVVTAIFILLLVTSGIELLFFILLIGGVFLFYDRFFRQRLIQIGRQGEIESQKLIKSVNEGIYGLKEIRVLGKEEYFHHRVLRASMEISRGRKIAGLISILPKSLFELVIVVFIVTLVVAGVAFGKGMSDLASVLSIFAIAAVRLIPSSNLIVAAFSNLGQSRSAVNLLYTDLIRLNSIKKLHQTAPTSNSTIFESVELQEISYSYEGARIGALCNVSLSLQLGETIGFLGTSGAGKSTLVDIMLGFLTPERGRLILNGRELPRKGLNQWIQQVAYIPQTIFLIDDTLKKNIALGLMNEEIDDDKISEAIDRSNLSELVKQLPNGINTIIGERGIRLSGGQQQRIAIARAFYFGRNVLIMDEATSALDNHTEAEIVEEIRRLKGQKAIIIIAHRLSTLKYCDRVYRLEQGKIVEEGSYQTVVESKKG